MVRVDLNIQDYFNRFVLKYVLFGHYTSTGTSLIVFTSQASQKAIVLKHWEKKCRNTITIVSKHYWEFSFDDVNVYWLLISWLSIVYQICHADCDILEIYLIPYYKYFMLSVICCPDIDNGTYLFWSSSDLGSFSTC